MPVDEAPTCPKCGEKMVLLPDTTWSLWEIHTIDAMCPNCLHVEKIVTIVAERAKRAVKEHSEYKGTKQTVITRPKIAAIRKGV